jgi:hypothetical protein
MVKVDDDAVVPELLDHIFSYLDCEDLYACSVVNRQFYSTAIRYLYRDLSFSLYQKNRRKPQTQLWLHLLQHPHLFDHIERLWVCLDNGNWRKSAQNTNIAKRKFSDCMLYILRHAKNLKRIVLIHQSKDEEHIRISRYCHDEADSALTSILDLLPDLSSHPDVQLALYHHMDGCYEVDGYELALKIARCLTVSSLSVTDQSVAHISPAMYWKKFLWISQFSHLKELDIHGTIAEDLLFEEYDDLEQLFENIPLETMRLLRTKFSFKSLPSTLRALFVDLSYMSHCINFSSWKAICNLKQLNSLYLDIGRWKEEGWPELPIPFKSSCCLRKLDGVLCRYMTDNADFMEKHIVQPIFNGGSPRHVHFELPLGTTANPLSIIFPIGRHLTSLKIMTRYSSAVPYSFDGLVQALSSTPHLVNLYFPWPTINSKTPSREQQLDFSHCLAIANFCPYLDTIEFHLQTYEYDNDVFSKHDFTKPLGREGTPRHGSNCDACVLDIPSRLQSFKMSHFIAQGQPCLNVCTVLFDFLRAENYRRYLLQHRILLDLFLSVDLNQARRHMDIP